MATNATVEPKAAPPAHKEVEHFSDAERTEWLKTGAMPPLEEVKKDSPSDDKSKDASAASKPASAAGGKDSGSGPGKKERDEERNWRTLESERDTLRAKAEAAEKELEEFRTGKRKPEEPPPEAAAFKLLEKPKLPKPRDFLVAGTQSVDEEKYDAACTQYEKDSDAFLAQQKDIIGKEREQERYVTNWQSEIKTIYGKEIAIENIHKVVGKLAETQQKSPAVFVHLQTSKFFPHLVKVFEGDPVLLDKFIAQANDPKTFPDAVRALFGMERDIETELEKQKKEPAEKEAKPLTKAGKPPAEAAGGSSTPEDDGSAESAWKRKDLSATERGELYRERKNKEEREKKRKKVN